MKKHINNKKGIVLPLALLLMIASAITIWSAGVFLLDVVKVNSDERVTDIAQREAENALVYGVWGSNTLMSDGGHKCGCSQNWYTVSGDGYEITNEDGGITVTDEGYIIKRFVSFKDTTDYSDALLTGIAKIYDKNNNLLAEKAVQMHVNLLFSGDENKKSDNLCDAISVQMKKETYKNISTNILNEYTSIGSIPSNNLCTGKTKQ